ncbi:hypothetical protein V5O48_008468 [Marasmius crinis-equi]|uniref:Uncharacterized protein n=1 Tax=Marasmius crinis-equi TaxID=585013 RepID=A0ABR3FDT2_9AGAR
MSNTSANTAQQHSAPIQPNLEEATKLLQELESQIRVKQEDVERIKQSTRTRKDSARNKRIAEAEEQLASLKSRVEVLCAECMTLEKIQISLQGDVDATMSTTSRKRSLSNASVSEVPPAKKKQESSGESSEGQDAPMGEGPVAAATAREERPSQEQASPPMSVPMVPGPGNTASEKNNHLQPVTEGQEVEKNGPSQQPVVQRALPGQGRRKKPRPAQPEEGSDDDDGEREEEYYSPHEVHERARLAERARQAVQRFLNAPTIQSNRIPGPVRTYIRKCASHCREAGLACFDLARDALVTRESLLKCIYHHHLDKVSIKRDEKDGFMTGVPYQPKGKEIVPLLEKIPGVQAAYRRLQLPTTPDGREYCHCGCSLEDAVWGLYLWKMGKIRYQDGREQGYETESKPPEPRVRGFQIQAIRSLGFELDDLWTHELDMTTWTYRPLTEEGRIQKRIWRLVGLLQSTGSASLPGPSLGGLLTMDEGEGESEDEGEVAADSGVTQGAQSGA